MTTVLYSRYNILYKTIIYIINDLLYFKEKLKEKNSKLILI